jgi:hypothetical protein
MGEVTPPEVEYGIRVARLRNALDYVVVARTALDSLIENVARATLEISVAREEHRLSMLLHAVDMWLLVLDESARYLQKAREYLLSVKEKV